MDVFKVFDSIKREGFRFKNGIEILVNPYKNVIMNELIYEDHPKGEGDFGRCNDVAKDQGKIIKKSKKRDILSITIELTLQNLIDLEVLRIQRYRQIRMNDKQIQKIREDMSWK
ncbi:unnamed protein product [Paramecium octaurelia]|uniref:Uncharacterized protein n=1 Tax=Paramecium octaurelia TaxID=43137 RepID=A0A8S1VHM3_PAROT|nr:unnamed protein product [Paramecium octaurelia]